MDLFFVVDKPAGITSHDVVAMVRAVVGEKQVGHTGTLDPFATGVLALAIGGTTKLLQYLDESVKVYDLTVALGRSTETGDPTGEVLQEAPVPPIDRAGVEAVLATFLGDRMQSPPAYSAVKHQGRPLYWYARRGEVVTVPARPIHVSEIRLLDVQPTELRLVVSCSKGTYARVLAEEIAEALGTVGHLSALSRLQSGPFLIEDAVTAEWLAETVSSEPGHPWTAVLRGRREDPRVQWKPRDEVRAAVKAKSMSPLRALSHLPLLDVDAEDARKVRFGNVPAALPLGVPVGGRYLVVHGDALLAVGEVTPRGPQLLRVLGAAESGGRDDRRRGGHRPGRRGPPSGGPA